MQHNHRMWCERYRPSSINDYIFQDESLKNFVLKSIKDKSFPHLLLTGTQGTGKAQPHHSKVLTPTGWITIGDVVPGTQIVTPGGDVANVKSIHPQGMKQIYKITFHDGSSAECCAEHLWDCWYTPSFSKRNATKLKSTVSTQWMIDYMNSSIGRHFNLSIDLITPPLVDNGMVDCLPVDPYSLGALIGDGSMVGSGIKFTAVENHIVNKVKIGLGAFSFKQYDDSKEWGISDPDRRRYGSNQNRLKTILLELGLWGCFAHQKHIPSLYQNLINPISKLNLIKGLMDTDGTVGKQGDASFTTTSYQLALDIQQLLWSVGATCTIAKPRSPKYTYKGEVRTGRLSYTLHFNHNDGVGQFFSLPRKVDRCKSKFAENHNNGPITLRRRVKTIEPLNIQPATCIYVDHPDHLYITNDYVITHNTTLAQLLLKEIGVLPEDTRIINASDENSVDMVRDITRTFATTFPMGAFKVVVLEEADRLSIDAQGVLKMVMETHSDNLRFIFTSNREHKIIPALKSRMQHFRFKKSDPLDVTEYTANVLSKERISFSMDLLDKYVAIGYPDIRKIIQLVQQHSIDGVLQPPSDVDNNQDFKFTMLELIQKGNWVDLRKLASSTVGTDEWEDLYRFLYDNIHRCPSFAYDKMWDDAIILIAEHLYRNAICSDQEINFTSLIINLTKITKPT